MEQWCGDSSRGIVVGLLLTGDGEAAVLRILSVRCRDETRQGPSDGIRASRFVLYARDEDLATAISAGPVT